MSSRTRFSKKLEAETSAILIPLIALLVHAVIVEL